MIRTSPEGKQIEKRLRKDSLFVDQANFRIAATNGNTEFFRAPNGALVLHKIRSNSFHGLNASQTAFNVPLPPQVRATNQPFTPADLLRDASYYELARHAAIKAVKDNGPSLALTAVAGAAATYAAPYASSAVSSAWAALHPETPATKTVAALRAGFTSGVPSGAAAAGTAAAAVAATAAAGGRLDTQSTNSHNTGSTEWWDDSDSDSDSDAS